MANPFVHCELATHDVARAKDFYGRLFDWQLTDVPMPEGTYTMIGVGDGTGGGMLKHPVPDAPALWVPYVLVADIHAATKKVRELGGTVMRDVTEVPNMGWFSIFADPTGAHLGLWQTKS